MRLKLTLIIFLLILGALAFQGCCPHASESLTVTLHPQETSQWCWAASGQMVMHYLGHNVSQCTQANNRFGRADCCSIDLCPLPTETPCNSPGGHPCACGGWPEFPKYNFDFQKTSSAALSWTDLKRQISTGSGCEGTPYCFSWHWNGGGGHMMVVIGYTTVDSTNMVEINDPWAPCVGDHRFITYTAYVSGSTYTHWDDYYNIKYTGP